MRAILSIGVICGALLSLPSAANTPSSLLRPLGYPDPRPFRLDDALSGRNFDYNAESFLHRFTYRSLTPLRSGLPRDREGLYGTAGSTRSNELYTVMQLQKTLWLDNDYFLRYRFVRDEDFDGRYDRNLLEIGRDIGERWNFGFVGDVQGDKSRIDLEAQLSWDDGIGSHARFVLVAPDALFNDKQREAQFTKNPYTGFLDLRWQVHDATALWTYLNLNMPMRLRNEALDMSFSDRQTTLGLGMDTALGNTWHLSVWLESESVERRRQSLADATNAAGFERNYREAGAQLAHDLRLHLQVWGGLRILRLEETGRHSPDPLDELRLRRKEMLIYTGVSWRLGERYRFHPGVYLNFVDNTEHYPNAAARDRQDDGFAGKLALPLEVTVHRATGAALTINPTVRLHRLAFGGGNIQAHLPF